MSRHGCTDDIDDVLSYGQWRGQVASAIRGKRGQKFLTELAAAMDEMPSKRLIKHQLESAEGEFCTVGVMFNAKGIDTHDVNYNCAETIGELVDIARQLVAEIEYVNDECDDFRCVEVHGPPRGRWQAHPYIVVYDTPEQRWQRMRDWVQDRIASPSQGGE